MTSGKGIRYTIELQKEMRAKLPFDDKLASEGAMAPISQALAPCIGGHQERQELLARIANVLEDNSTV